MIILPRNLLKTSVFLCGAFRKKGDFMPFKKGFPAVSERKNVPKYLEKWISFLIFAIANDFNALLNGRFLVGQISPLGFFETSFFVSIFMFN